MRLLPGSSGRSPVGDPAAAPPGLPQVRQLATAGSAPAVEPASPAAGAPGASEATPGAAAAPTALLAAAAGGLAERRSLSWQLLFEPGVAEAEVDAQSPPPSTLAASEAPSAVPASAGLRRRGIMVGGGIRRRSSAARSSCWVPEATGSAQGFLDMSSASPSNLDLQCFSLEAVFAEALSPLPMPAASQISDGAARKTAKFERCSGRTRRTNASKNPRAARKKYRRSYWLQASNIWPQSSLKR